jgi:hypothetical protein
VKQEIVDLENVIARAPRLAVLIMDESRAEVTDSKRRMN